MTAQQYSRSMAFALLFIALQSCHFPGKSKTGAIPVPDPPHAATAKVTARPKPPDELPPPPQIDSKAPEVKPEVTTVMADQPVPPMPKPSKRRVTAKKNPAPILATPVTEPQPPAGSEAVPVPKLGELITEDQRASYLKACDERLSRARRALNQIKGVSLTNEQTETVDRIRTFIGQAEQARQQDPQTARQLAERADLLSRDLVRSVR